MSAGSTGSRGAAAPPGAGAGLSRAHLVALVALPVLIADFTTKFLAVRLLEPLGPRRVIGNAVRFTLAYNRQGVMGLPFGPASRWLLSGVTVAVLAVLVRMLRGTAPEQRLRAASLALIIGGAVGNLLDRLAHGAVVDFIDVGTSGWRFWTFNVADMAIDVGVALLAWTLWRTPARGTATKDGGSRPGASP